MKTRDITRKKRKKGMAVVKKEDERGIIISIGGKGFFGMNKKEKRRDHTDIAILSR